MWSLKSIKSLISMKSLLIKLFFFNWELFIKILEFISKFLDNPDPNEPYHFPIDTELSEKLREWPEAFMFLLLQYHKKYKLHGIHEPPEVMRNTEEYHNESDIFRWYLDGWSSVRNS